MANVATLSIKVITDADKAAADLGKVSDQSGFKKGLDKASLAAAGAGLALIGFGKAAFDSASEAQQAGGAVDAVYGDAADTIHKFSKTAAQDVGLASSQYEQMAAGFGAQLKNMGIAAGDLAPQTDELIGLGADLAAQFGGTTADAVGALGSLMRGETDPIEKYGVSIKAADVAAQKAEMGLSGLTGEADKAATTQAMLALLTEQTADANGAFAREANTAAGQQQRANAQFEDASAAIGSALLPLVSKAAQLFGKLGGFVKDNAGAFQIFGAAVAGVVAIVLAVKAATMAWQAAQLVAKVATMAWQGAQWLLNAAMTANPIGLLIAGVVALIAVIVLIVKNWDTVTAALRATWDWLSANWPLLLAILTGPFGLAIKFIVDHWEEVKAVAKEVFDAIGKAISAAIGWIGRLIGTISGAFTSAWNTLRDTAVGVFNTVKGAADTAMRGIETAITWPIDKAKELWNFLSGAFTSIWGTVKDTAVRAFQAITSPIQKVIDKINDLIGVVRDVIGWLGRIKFPDIGGFISSINPFSAVAPTPGPSAAPRVGLGARAVGGGFSSTGGAGITINVSGALDPDAVARQIEKLLRAHARRVGGVGQLAVGARP